MYTFNPSIWEADICEFKISLIHVIWVPEQSLLHTETLFQRERERDTRTRTRTRVVSDSPTTNTTYYLLLPFFPDRDPYCWADLNPWATWPSQCWDYTGMQHHTWLVIHCFLVINSSEKTLIYMTMTERLYQISYYFLHLFFFGYFSHFTQCCSLKDHLKRHIIQMCHGTKDMKIHYPNINDYYLFSFPPFWGNVTIP